MRKKKATRVLLGLIFLCFMMWIDVPLTLSSPPPDVIKTLIVTGQNNHNWEASSPILEKILDDSGLFQADVATSPPTAAPPKRKVEPTR